MANEVHGVVIRISDSSAIGDLEKKVRETAAMHPTIPGAALLDELGAAPMRDPARVDGQTVNLKGFRAVVFRLPGTLTWVLMALGSATKVNLGEDDNAFVTLLGDTLSATPVTRLWVADFARLLRSVDYFSQTWRAVRTQCRYVHHAGTVIDTSSPSAEIQFLFEALSAAADARFTVRRTTNGKMRSYVSGRCPLSQSAVPLGYIKTPEKTLALAAPATHGVVRAIIRSLGDPALTHQDRVAAVAAAGGVSAIRSDRLRRAVRLDELHSPGTMVSRWYELLEVWRTGQWSVEYDLPALLNNDNFELPVEIYESHGTRTWRMTFDLGLPEGGWATEEEFAAAIALRDRRAERLTPSGGAAAGSTRKPLCGLDPWITGDSQLGLFSGRAGVYELRRRSATDAGARELVGGTWRWVARGWGRGPNREGEVVARLNAKTLHRAVALGLAAAAEDGLRHVASGSVPLDLSEPAIEELSIELSQQQRVAANARRNANEAANEIERRAYLAESQQATHLCQDLETALLRMAGAHSADRIPIDGRALSLALGRLAETADHVPGYVADALRLLLTDFRMGTTANGLVRWEACLRLPVAGGTLTVGPATGQLANGLRRSLAAARNASLRSRAAEATAAFMSELATVEDVAARLDIRTHRRVAQTIRDHLGSLGVSESETTLLVGHTPLSARTAVWSRLEGLPFPQHLSPAWADHAASAYLCDDVVASRAVAEAAARRQSAVDWVRARGGWIPGNQRGALASAVGISSSTVGELTDGRRRRGRWIPPVLAERDGGIGLIACPHGGCGGWASVVSLLPEVGAGVLCPACRRMPLPKYEALVFPPDYFGGE